MGTRKNKPAAVSTTDEAGETSTDLLVKQWERERPDLDLTAFGILLRISGLSMMMRQYNQPFAGMLGIRTHELWVLYALRRGGKPYQMRPTDIFKLLKVNSGTMTYRLDRLQETGMIERVPDPNDRRSVLIQLTAKGKRSVDLAMETSARQAAITLYPITQDKKRTQQFISLLRQLGTLYEGLIPNADNPLVHGATGKTVRKAPARRTRARPTASS
jgi:DNA-binding MarR family transcriptional regulator